MADPANPIVLYDGVCGLCNRLVQFVLQRDTEGHFRFSSLQSDYASRLLQGRNVDPHDLDTVYVVDALTGRLLARSDAVIFILHRLGGFWRALSVALRIFPKSLCNWGYGVIARNRYRVFGKYEICLLPAKEHQDRFLDM